MGWFILMNLFSVLLSLVRTRNLSDQEKDLDILILRKQLTILQRKLDKPIRPNRTDKLILSVLAKRLKILSNQSTAQLQSVIRIFQPSTVMRWQSFPRTIGDRQLVRLKWTHKRKNIGGRPPIDKDLEFLIVRLAKENPRWGYE